MSNVPLPESVEFWGDIPVKTKSMLAMKTLASGIKGSEKSTTILAISPVPSAANDIIVQACIQVVVKVKNNRTSYTIPLVLVHTTTVTHDHCDGSAAAARLRRLRRSESPSSKESRVAAVPEVFRIFPTKNLIHASESVL